MQYYRILKKFTEESSNYEKEKAMEKNIFQDAQVKIQNVAKEA
jgi:hypothetical protein